MRLSDLHPVLACAVTTAAILAVCFLPPLLFALPVMWIFDVSYGHAYAVSTVTYWTIGFLVAIK